MPTDLDTLRAALADLGRPVPDGLPADAPLDLASIEVVMLHDLLEQAFALRIPAAEVSREAFVSLASLARLVARIRGEP